jgi:hypothetical protein
MTAQGLGRLHLINSEQLEATYKQEAKKAYDLLQTHLEYRELIESLAKACGLPMNRKAIPKNSEIEN